MKKKKAQLVGNLTSHILKTMEEIRKIEKNNDKNLDKSK
jgi:hypothetical protein|tara:strand:+ start:163 stop:279 length:117 start_codon:yes stop_codon:yes gene_type:complete